MGISVGSASVRAVLVTDGSIRWAGAATYDDEQELADVIARLAAEGNGAARPGRVCVVLERPVIQLRTILPAPPLTQTAARRWLQLQASRLFRKNGAPLITDGRLLRLSASSRALLAAAVPEPLVHSILTGCAGAGLAVDAIGAAAEVVPLAAKNGTSGVIALSNGARIEAVEVEGHAAWRSRWISRGESTTADWVPGLATLGEQASRFAPAYGAAMGAPSLALFPNDVRVERERRALGRVLRVAAVGVALWVAAGATYVLRLSATLHSSMSFLGAVQSSIDSNLAMRHELRTAQEALEVVDAAERTRSRQLALLVAVTAALPDSVYVVSLRVTADGVVRVSGYAPVAARALAALERVPGWRGLRFEEPVSRETVQGIGDRDRFAIVARTGEGP